MLGRVGSRSSGIHRFRTVQGQPSYELSNRRRQRRGPNTDAPPTGKDAQSVELVEAVADDFLSARAEVEGFWTKIEEEYHDRRTERQGNAQDVVDSIPPGFVYNHTHYNEGQIHGRPPKFFVTAAHAAKERQAKQFELATNAEWSMHGGLDQAPKLALRDTIKKGLGVAITEFTGNPRPRSEFGDEDDPTVEAILRQVRQEGAIADAMMAPPEKKLDYELDARRLVGQSMTRRVSPWDFFCDPVAESLEQVTVIGREVLADVEMLKRHPVMGRRAAGMTAHMIKAEQKDRRFRRARWAGDRRKKVVLREAYFLDFHGEWKKIIYAAASRKVLMLEDSPYWFGHPYSVCRWNDDGDCFIPQSDFTNLWKLQASQQLLLTRVVQGFARLQNQPTFFDKSMGFDPANLVVTTHPELGLLIGVEGDGATDLSRMFYRPPNDPVIGNAIPILQVLERALQQASGQGSNQIGQALKSETSATEAREIAQQAALRGSHRNRGYERFILDIARKRMFLMAQFYGVEDMARLIGQEARDWPDNFEIGDVQNGLFLHIEQGSMTPISDRTRFQQIQGLLQTLANIPGGFQVVNFPELVGRLAESLGLRRDDPIIQVSDPAAAGAILEGARLAEQSQGSSPAPGATASGEAGVEQLAAGQ